MELIIQILFARDLDFLLKLRRLDRSVDDVEGVQCCLDEDLVYLVEEVFDWLILVVMNLLRNKAIRWGEDESKVFGCLPSQSELHLQSRRQKRRIDWTCRDSSDALCCFSICARLWDLEPRALWTDSDVDGLLSDNEINDLTFLHLETSDFDVYLHFLRVEELLLEQRVIVVANYGEIIATAHRFIDLNRIYDFLFQSVRFW